jgi:hypothetical protein
MSRDFSHVENEAAYFKAIDQRISVNRVKGRTQRWYKEDPSRESLMMLLAREEARSGSFMEAMQTAFEQWGSLTLGQEAAVRKVFDSRTAKRAEYRERDAASAHFGTEGKREIFTLTVRNIVEFETSYGTMRITIMADGAGNIAIHKGHSLPVAKGETYTMKATVKEHGSRDGILQTVLSRPKLEA